MPVFTLEEGKAIKETIEKLNLQSTKEALRSITQVLTTSPTLRASLFVEIIADAFKLTQNKNGG
jgi:hypothetical protein